MSNPENGALRQAQQQEKKMPSTFPAMFLVMLVLALFCGLGLGLSYMATKDPIAANLLRKEQEALLAVLPAFDNDAAAQAVLFTSDERIKIFPASLAGQPVGTAVLSYSDLGFSGTISAIVGFGREGQVLDVQLVQMSETPGLGTKIALESFISQFRGIGIRDEFPLAVRQDGGQVDAVTAATISSRALVDALNKAKLAEQAHRRELVQ